MTEFGTRTPSNLKAIRSPVGTETRTHTRDIGMSKRASFSATFVAASKQIQGANGTFTAFKVEDILLIEGTNLNNGWFEVTGIDVSNQAYLVLDPPPKNEGPLTTLVRTA